MVMKKIPIVENEKIKTFIVMIAPSIAGHASPVAFG